MMPHHQRRFVATIIEEIFGEVSPSLWFAKILGALAGSLVSIAYILPRGRREAILRLIVGIAVGLIFGGIAGLKLADAMGLLEKMPAFEIALMGATFASACAWWGLGALQRLALRWSGGTLRSSTKSARERKKQP